MQAAGAFLGDDFEMKGFAANDDAERDEGVVAAARRQARSPPELERAGHGDRFMLMAGGVDRRARAGEQHVIEVRVESRLDDQDCRHDVRPRLAIGRPIGRSSTIASP